MLELRQGTVGEQKGAKAKTRILPILYNTDMVCALLDGRKTATRRLIKPQPNDSFDRHWESFIDERGEEIVLMAPYRAGDILYVRETWRLFDPHGDFKYDNRTACLQYFAGLHCTYRRITPEMEKYLGNRWHPSIHMPKEFTRIFLHVTDVRAERLQEIKNEECVREGAVNRPHYTKRHDLVLHERYRSEFAALWDSTVKPAARDKCGWVANPWVWAIEFERCGIPEGWPPL